MKNKYKFVIFTFILVDVLLYLYILIHGKNVQLLNSKGLIAIKERNLILTALFLASTVVIPVFIATFLIVRKYRENNTNSDYSPDWTGNNQIKLIWWSIPTVVILILAILAWNGAHALDPYKPIASPVKPLTIQVVALDWKWLFIYPEQNIATVNFIQFPTGTPINFELTADAPMNSFWIPQLGGQMYAMPGMETQLHLIADVPGDFPGTEVEINGSGFAGMKFTTRASSLADFNNWVQSIKQSSSPLNSMAYNRLVKPSEYNPTAYYAPVDENLYNEIVMKYMVPSSTPMQDTTQQIDQNNSNAMQGMDMKNINY